MIRLVAVLLIAPALGFCPPAPSEAVGPVLPGIFSPEAQFTSVCDGGANDLGAANAKTSVVVLSAGRSDIAPAGRQPSGAAVPRVASAPRDLALDVPASRAPPLA